MKIVLINTHRTKPPVAPIGLDYVAEALNAAGHSVSLLDPSWDDTRFLFYDPSRPKQNYNYNANQRLAEAIQQGYRGAFWDILRRYVK